MDPTELFFPTCIFVDTFVPLITVRYTVREAGRLKGNGNTLWSRLALT
jgi:hypothetical protein